MFKFFGKDSTFGGGDTNWAKFGNLALNSTKAGQEFGGAMSLADYIKKMYGAPTPTAQPQQGETPPQDPTQQYQLTAPFQLAQQPEGIQGIPNQLNNGGILGLVGKVAGFI